MPTTATATEPVRHHRPEGGVACHACPAEATHNRDATRLAKLEAAPRGGPS